MIVSAAMMARAAMRSHGLILVAALVWLTAADGANAAGTEAEFSAALSAAEAVENEAAALKNRWTLTEQAIAAAKQAAAAGDFAAAIDHARHAEALAKASVAQAREQEEAWRAAVIH